MPETDHPSHLADVQNLYLGAGPEHVRPVHAQSLRVQPFRKGEVTIVAKLEGVDSREDAEALRGLGLYATQDDLPPLEEGEVFLHEIIGMEVVLKDATAPIGRVRDVLEGGSQLLFAISREGKSEILLPDVPEFVVRVDVAEKRLVVDPPEGLFD